MNVEEFVGRHVALFNDGVRTGDFAPMIGGFPRGCGADLHRRAGGAVSGTRCDRGGLSGDTAHDEIEILSILEREGGEIVAAYSWTRDQGRRAGDMIFRTIDGAIARLVVTFEAQAS